MPTAPDMAVLKETQKALDANGISTRVIDRTRPMGQWYRADGFAFPNLLPADAYHIKRYQARGMTLIAPVGITVEPSSAASTTLLPPPPHAHRFGKAMGSECKVEGCEATRTRPFAKRK